MMKLLNTILLLTAFTGHVTAQNNCACYPLQYNFSLDLLDFKKECDYTYQDGVITKNNDEGPNPTPPGIANLDFENGGNPAAFEYVGCSTKPTITELEVVIVEIEEFGPDENAVGPLKAYSFASGINGELFNGDTISYQSITAEDPTAIVKTLKVYMGLKGLDANGNEEDQTFQFEVRYSNLCNALPYTENDFAGFLNFDSSVFPDSNFCDAAPSISPSPSVSVVPSIAPSVACDEGSKGSKSSSKGSKSSSKGSKSSKSCKSPKSPTMSKGSKSSSYKTPTLSSSKGKGSKSTSLKLRRREA